MAGVSIECEFFKFVRHSQCATLTAGVAVEELAVV